PVTEERLLTMWIMREMMAEISESIQSTIKTQIQSLRREIHEIGNRTSHIESKMDEYTTSSRNLKTSRKTQAQTVSPGSVLHVNQCPIQRHIESVTNADLEQIH
ncbi:---NA---, partial [Pelobates cultripes]